MAPPLELRAALCVKMMETFQHPVMTRCEHIFEKNEIERYIASKGENAPCPSCDKHITVAELVDNFAVRNILNELKEKFSQQSQQAAAPVRKKIKAKPIPSVEISPRKVQFVEISPRKVQSGENMRNEGSKAVHMGAVVTAIGIVCPPLIPIGAGMVAGGSTSWFMGLMTTFIRGET